MKDALLKLFVKMQTLNQDHGQDLIEYVLVGAIVALGAVAGMGTVATKVNGAFSTIASIIAANAT